jgi:superoxide dismutase, Cu-Zn family
MSAGALWLVVWAGHGCGGQSTERVLPGESEPAAGQPVADRAPGDAAGAVDLTRIQAPVIDATGNVAGSVLVEQLEEGGVRVRLHVEGLDPGLKAVHFHEHARCDPPDFESAGDHYNPTEAPHGMPRPGSNSEASDHHAGDMFNQRVDDQGVMSQTVINWSVNLDQGRNRLLDDGGSALVIHERPDDYETQPAGDAGSRVACAVISR